MESAGRITSRVRSLDEIAEALPQRAAMLSRVFVSRATVQICRTEMSVLWTLSRRPRRITELAAREGVSQPGITRLVNRLADRGWVSREPDPADGRVVLVTLTAAGRAAVERLRDEYRAVMHEEMATLADREVHTLAEAIEILDRLIERVTGQEP